MFDKLRGTGGSKSIAYTTTALAERTTPNHGLETTRRAVQFDMGVGVGLSRCSRGLCTAKPGSSTICPRSRCVQF